MSSSQATSILEVKNLSAEFRTSDGKFLAIDNVSWSIEPGDQQSTL